jgi:uncharacterized protein YydD (DUF2326 family)
MNNLNYYRLKLENIEKYRKLVNEYKNKIEEIKKGFSDQNIETNNYLKDQQLLIEKNILLFKSFAEQFYINKKSRELRLRITKGKIKIDLTLKLKLMMIKAMEVNDVKIFCFDWTLLKAQHNHKIKFIFHDGRLLSEIDTRQVATIFHVAYENTHRNNFQYIISTNQNILDSVRKEMIEEDYHTIISDSIILELTDESNESKLLGIQLDLDYDKE